MAWVVRIDTQANIMWNSHVISFHYHHFCFVVTLIIKTSLSSLELGTNIIVKFVVDNDDIIAIIGDKIDVFIIFRYDNSIIIIIRDNNDRFVSA